MLSNSEVIRAWTHGCTAKAKHLSTDGVRLYSYALLIAQGREVYDYTADSLGFISMTTSHHVAMAKRALLNYS